MANLKEDAQRRIQGLIKDVEGLAKNLRTTLRKRADVAAVVKEVEKATNQFRKQAAATVGHVEKYIHTLRKELDPGSGAAKKKRPAAKKAAKKKAATRAN